MYVNYYVTPRMCTPRICTPRMCRYNSFRSTLWTVCQLRYDIMEPVFSHKSGPIAKYIPFIEGSYSPSDGANLSCLFTCALRQVCALRRYMNHITGIGGITHATGKGQGRGIGSIGGLGRDPCGAINEQVLLEAMEAAASVVERAELAQVKFCFEAQ